MGKTVASAAPRRGFKEFVRKFFVSLKRNPHNIALFMMLFSFVFYSLNLTKISDTTAYINRANMGQCQFLAMLLGVLSCVSFMRAFPRREKPKLLMIGLTLVMLIINVLTQLLYSARIAGAINDPDFYKNMVDPSTNELTDIGRIITGAQPIVVVHTILLAACVVLILGLPVYSKLIRKINTSIEVAGNENMGTIDVEDE